MNGLSRLPRLYMDPALVPTAQEGAPCPIAPEQARYLGTVLRKKAGEQVRVFHAGMGEWLASIAEIRKDRGGLTLERQLRAPQPCPPLRLAFALLKRDATDLVLRMGTELGVTEFLPLVTERTNTHRINRAPARHSRGSCRTMRKAGHTGHSAGADPARLAGELAAADKPVCRNRTAGRAREHTPSHPATGAGGRWTPDRAGRRVERW